VTAPKAMWTGHIKVGDGIAINQPYQTNGESGGSPYRDSLSPPSRTAWLQEYTGSVLMEYVCESSVAGAGAPSRSPLVESMSAKSSRKKGILFEPNWVWDRFYT
jgi:hypothetical protein